MLHYTCNTSQYRIVLADGFSLLISAWSNIHPKLCSFLIRQNTDLIGTLDEHVLDEDVRKQLLELSEEKHDEKREALAVFNNQVNQIR